MWNFLDGFVGHQEHVLVVGGVRPELSFANVVSARTFTILCDAPSRLWEGSHRHSVGHRFCGRRVAWGIWSSRNYSWEFNSACSCGGGWDPRSSRMATHGLGERGCWASSFQDMQSLKLDIVIAFVESNFKPFTSGPMTSRLTNFTSPDVGRGHFGIGRRGFWCFSLWAGMVQMHICVRACVPKEARVCFLLVLGIPPCN